jgi:hypothetical protein
VLNKKRSVRGTCLEGLGYEGGTKKGPMGCLHDKEGLSGLKFARRPVSALPGTLSKCYNGSVAQYSLAMTRQFSGCATVCVFAVADTFSQGASRLTL